MGWLRTERVSLLRVGLALCALLVAARPPRAGAAAPGSDEMNARLRAVEAIVAEIPAPPRQVRVLERAGGGAGPGTALVDAPRWTPEVFDAVAKETIANIASVAEAERPPASRTVRAGADRRAQRSGGLTSLGEANTAGAVDVASAAIRTSIDGADAGMTLAPFPLLGWDTGPHQAKVTVAALKDAKTRLALGYAWAPLPPLLTYDDLGLGACKPTGKAAEARAKAIEDRRGAYARVCAILVAAIPEPPLDTAEQASKGQRPHVGWETAWRACGFALPSGAPPRKDGGITLESATNAFVHAYERALDRLGPDTREGRDLERRRDWVAADLALLRTYRDPYPDACNADRIGDAYVQATWRAPRPSLGVSGTGEWFARISGFDPDPGKPLARGDLGKVEGRLEGDFQRRRWHVTAGLGVSRARAEPSDPLQTLLSPSVAVTWVARALGADPLLDEDENITVRNGVVVPTLTLGLSATADLALRRPESQDTVWQAFTATAFLEFRFTKDLVARLGVPYSGAVVTRKADATQGIAERRALQYAIPVFVATSLKLP